jgi:hypothetical protein
VTGHLPHDHPNGTTTLAQTASIAFRAVSAFTIDQIVIESASTSGNFIIDDSPSGDTDLSGDGDTSIPSGNLSYTFGGE